MIMDALFLIKSELNDYIRQRLNPEKPEHIFLSNIVDGNGNSLSPEDEISITLTSIEEEATNKEQRCNRIRQDKTYSFTEPEIRLNLYVIVSVRPGKNTGGSTKYVDALARLSMVAVFFQSHPYFDQSRIRNPNVSDNLKRVIVDLHSVSFEAQSYIWGTHGGHYIPSLLYKVRLIHILEDTITKEVPVVETVDVGSDDGGL